MTVDDGGDSSDDNREENVAGYDDGKDGEDDQNETRVIRLRAWWRL